MPPPRRTGTCSTSTTTWPRSSICACASSPGRSQPLAIDTEVGDRIASELAGPGDLLQQWDPGPGDLLERRYEYRTLVPSRLALLDAAFTERVRPWPQVGNVLLRRAGRRAGDLNLQRAIAGQPRLEVRLTLLLWHLAARWGRVEPGGIRVPVPLTHRLLGRLVGAERPSVSHALTRLSHAGAVTRPVEFTPGQAHTERQLVNVIWMTAGLSCDGESVALTSATSPSLEDLIRGTLPGMPGLVIYNPLLAYETGVVRPRDQNGT